MSGYEVVAWLFLYSAIIAVVIYVFLLSVKIGEDEEE